MKNYLSILEGEVAPEKFKSDMLDSDYLWLVNRVNHLMDVIGKGSNKGLMNSIEKDYAKWELAHILYAYFNSKNASLVFTLWRDRRSAMLSIAELVKQPINKRFLQKFLDERDLYLKIGILEEKKK